MTAPWVWSVAGSDSSGGAGLQADLKTFAGFGVRGASITTALTAQSLQRVHAVEAVGIGMLEAQWQALATLGAPAAIKVGMLHGAEQVAWLARRLADYPGVPVVCDPVLLASDGTPLQQAGVRELFLRSLLPHISLLTPNLPEARWLLGAAAAADADPEQLAVGLRQAGAAAVLVKGGHGDSRAVVQDFFSTDDDRFWLTQARLPGGIHGSGCILAAAAAAALAGGYRLDDAVVLARRYLQQGWRLAAATGAAEGWFCHAGWPQQSRDLPVVSRSATVPAPGPFAGMGIEPIGLYPVVDSADWIARLLPLGISTIQLRIKQGESAWLRAQVAEAIALGRRYRARVFINDHWALALELGAWGVHLGQEDLDQADLAAIARAGLRLGLSNHSERELARAHALRPSYLALGPIYDTSTKVMRFAAQGLARLRGWVDLLGADYPLVAIGGIDAERLSAVLATGVGNVAVVRAITEAADPVAAVRQLRGQIADYRQ